MAKTRILIVDDHPMMRRGLRDTIAEDPNLEFCGEAEDIGPALDLVRAEKPELVIIDISLPSGSGLDLAKQILEFEAQTRILFVSMHDDTVFAERVLRAGALGYINKSSSGDKILAAIRKVARGEISLDKKLADQLVQRGAGRKPTPAGGGPGAPARGGSGVSGLTDRELEVFELIGRGLSTREIADRLSRSVKTIETHREHIKEKLALKSSNDVLRHALQWLMDQPTA